MAIPVMEFSRKIDKFRKDLERFLAKNQLYPNENIENWSSAELSKIGHCFRK
jgi:hypothetical protein